MGTAKPPARPSETAITYPHKNGGAIWHKIVVKTALQIPMVSHEIEIFFSASFNRTNQICVIVLISPDLHLILFQIKSFVHNLLFYHYKTCLPQCDIPVPGHGFFVAPVGLGLDPFAERAGAAPRDGLPEIADLVPETTVIGSVLERILE
jgi:hypothetical protein